MTEARRRTTGIPRRTLDRGKVYRIWYTGRRWEVLGAEGDSDATGGPPDGCPGADGEAASTGQAPGVPVAPNASRTESP